MKRIMILVLTLALVTGSWFAVNATSTAEAGLTDTEVETLDLLRQYGDVELYREDGRPVRALAGNSSDLLRVTIGEDAHPAILASVIERDGESYVQLIAEAHESTLPSCFDWCQAAAPAYCQPRYGYFDCHFVVVACSCRPWDYQEPDPHYPW